MNHGFSSRKSVFKRWVEVAVQDLIIQKINVSVVFIDGVATYRFAPLDNLGQEISALV